MRLISRAAAALAIGFVFASPAHADPEIGAKVVGGTAADPASWPFTVALVKASTADTFQAQFCGGSLVSSRAVVTAAHCVADLSAPEVQVATGARLDPGQPRTAVATISVHPSYTGSFGVHDVAVLALATPIDGATVPLASAGEDVPLQPAKVAGWGNAAGNGSSGYPTQLLSGDLFLNGGGCDGASFDRTWLLCADTNDSHAVSPCDGDSGGPLVSYGRLVGVVSYGPEHCHSQSFYVRVSAERSYLDAAVAAASGTTAPTPTPVTPAAALHLALSEAREVARAAVRRRYRTKARSIACSRVSDVAARCKVTYRKRGRAFRRAILIEERETDYTYRFVR